jgi:hypothetical protein
MTVSSKRDTVSFVFNMGNIELTEDQIKAIEARINSVVMEELAKTDVGPQYKGIGILSKRLNEKKDVLTKSLGTICGGYPPGPEWGMPSNQFTQAIGLT